MPRGRTTRLTLSLTPHERTTLLAWQWRPTIPARRARRGRILLLLEAGQGVAQVAREVGITRRHVYKWVRRFLAYGLQGLHDRPRRATAHRAWRQA